MNNEKIRSKYEYITDRGQVFVFNTYKCRGYCYDVRKLSGDTGKYIHVFNSYNNKDRSDFFMKIEKLKKYINACY